MHAYSQFGLFLLDTVLWLLIFPYFKYLNKRIKDIEVTIGVLKFKQEAINRQQDQLFRRFIEEIHNENQSKKN